MLREIFHVLAKKAGLEENPWEGVRHAHGRPARITMSVELEGRRHKTPEAIFHSLRHTFVSFAANAGELNRIVAYCRGPLVKIYVNGEKVIDADLTQWKDPLVNPDGTDIPKHHKEMKFPALGTIPMHGRIALQGVHGGRATRFKYLKVKELK